MSYLYRIVYCPTNEEFNSTKLDYIKFIKKTYKDYQITYELGKTGKNLHFDTMIKTNQILKNLKPFFFKALKKYVDFTKFKGFKKTPSGSVCTDKKKNVFWISFRRQYIDLTYSIGYNLKEGNERITGGYFESIDYKDCLQHYNKTKINREVVIDELNFRFELKKYITNNKLIIKSMRDIVNCIATMIQEGNYNFNKLIMYKNKYKINKLIDLYYYTDVESSEFKHFNIKRIILS